MIEVRLLAVNFNVQPLNSTDGEEGKQINFMHPPSQTTYCIPMNQEAADKLVASLSMTNEALDKVIQEEMLRQQIDVGGAVDLDAIRKGPPKPH